MLRLYPRRILYGLAVFFIALEVKTLLTEPRPGKMNWFAFFLIGAPALTLVISAIRSILARRAKDFVIETIGITGALVTKRETTIVREGVEAVRLARKRLAVAAVLLLLSWGLAGLSTIVALG